VIQTRAKPAFEPANLIVGLLPQKNKGETDMICIRYNHGTAKRFGTFGKSRIQRFRCNNCYTTFTTRRGPLGRHYITGELAATIPESLMEGMSVRYILPRYWCLQIHDLVRAAQFDFYQFLLHSYYFPGHSGIAKRDCQSNLEAASNFRGWSVRREWIPTLARPPPATYD
jgi:hypothetical protein